MGKISSEIIKECRGKHRALCSFCVTISILGISYKNSNLENTLLLSEDTAFHARWTFLCLSANSHCWLDVKSKANPERSRTAANAFLSEACIYRATAGGEGGGGWGVSSSDVRSHPGRLRRKIQSGLLLAEILGDWVRSADGCEGALLGLYTHASVAWF